MHTCPSELVRLCAIPRLPSYAGEKRREASSIPQNCLSSVGPDDQVIAQNISADAIIQTLIGGAPDITSRGDRLGVHSPLCARPDGVVSHVDDGRAAVGQKHDFWLPVFEDQDLSCFKL